MTKKLTAQEKQNRKPAQRACTFCHEKHLQCSNERPCKNCVRRNMADHCKDAVRKRAKYLTKGIGNDGSVNSNNNTPRKRRKKQQEIVGDKEQEEARSNSAEIKQILEIPPHITSPSTTTKHPLPDTINSTSVSSTAENQIILPVSSTVTNPNPFHAQPSNAIIHQQSSDIIIHNPAGATITTTTGVTTTVEPQSRPIIPTSKLIQSESQQHINTMLNTTNDVLNKLLNDDPLDQQESLHNLTPNSSITPQPNFNSNFLNQEYLMLGDIILNSKPSSPSPSNTSASEYNMISPSNSYFGTINIDELNTTNQRTHKRKVQRLKDSRPFISLGFPQDSRMGLNNLNNMAHQTDNLLDVNKDSTPQQHHTRNDNNQIFSQNNLNELSIEYVSPLITHHLYQSVSDIYGNSMINFDYPQSYHALTFFLKQRFSGINLSQEQRQLKRKNLLIILKLIASYRPTFISAHKSLLKPHDLLFLEMCFQRCLIDYEKLCQLNSSPTIIWRRTGEIVSITDDLLSLLGYNLGDILSKRTFIMELMYDDESIINYFQLFKSVAVGNLRSSIMTKLKLKRVVNNVNNNTSSSVVSGEDEIEHDKYIEFCTVWTVKRDLFDLPMLIVGQFLPILPTGDGIRMY
ncbi:GSM1 [[Candida] subhashii]|uniref:GSM1 n=1 Tax=[Candida] subhashii TaxID=561895 RepID=A0A8J5QPI0_9ASCO|nr:GSM1 [[Candida] subhashii]KAG7665458.1 GSM1 [[Candida] subhashii]